MTGVNMRDIKKFIAFILFIFIFISSGFCKKNDQKVALSIEALKVAEESFGVMPFKVPSENFTTLDDKFVRFGEYNIWGGNQLVEEFTFTQKKKRYIMKIQDASTTVSYGWEAYFKLINEENKVVQVIYKKDMEDAIYALYDCDFDGYDDLIFYTSQDKKANYYHVYYWNQTMKRFDKQPDKITSPYFDKKNKITITSEVVGNGVTEWVHSRYLGGGRKFVARVRIGVPENKADNGIRLAFTNKRNANFETTADVYLYDLPSLKSFAEKDEAEKKDIVRQYNAIMKRINGIN